MMSVARDGSLVRTRRQELRLHLKIVANRASCSPALVSMVEGGYIPKPARMLAIASALETSPDRLWPVEFDDAA